MKLSSAIVSFAIIVLANQAACSIETLVLLDNQAIKETHSQFFSSLQERGHILTYKLADDASLQLFKYGEQAYDNLLVFAPSVEEFGGQLGVDAIVKFIDAGGNVLVAGGPSTGDVLRELASEVGFEVDAEGSYVIDHVNYDQSDSGQHTRIVARVESLIESEVIVGKGDVEQPMLYEGTGLVVDSENSLVLPLLTAESTAYCHNPDLPIKEYPHAIGKRAVLIAGMQARNNARVVYSGSLAFFSDEFFEAHPVRAADAADAERAVVSGNRQAAFAITQWAFRARGTLRVVSVEHGVVGVDGTTLEPFPGHYTILDDIYYRIRVEVFDEVAWRPLRANDIQLEFVRIDPFVRVTLRPVGSDGTYEARFRVPDVYGVYQFKVDYDRVGYTRLHSTTQVSVRPLRHTQYERFILSAYPYYASAFSMMAGVFIFSFVFLHFKSDDNLSSGATAIAKKSKTH